MVTQRSNEGKRRGEKGREVVREAVREAVRERETNLAAWSPKDPMKIT